MEALAGGIEGNRDLILEDGKGDRMDRPGFRQPAHAMHAAQTGDDRLLDDGLAVGHAVKRRVEGPALDGKRVVPTDIGLPGERLDALKELRKGFRLEFAHAEENPLGEPGLEIGAHEDGLVPLEKDAAVLGGDRLSAHVPKLIRDQLFQSEKTGRQHPVCHLTLSFRKVFSVILSYPPPNEKKNLLAPRTSRVFRFL